MDNPLKAMKRKIMEKLDITTEKCSFELDRTGKIEQFMGAYRGDR